VASGGATPLPNPTAQETGSAVPAPCPAPLAPPDAGLLGKIDVLSEAEVTRYRALEAVVAAGWQTFADVGVALGQIRDERLYRTEFDTFEAYCRAKWHYARRYVYQLISAAQLFQHLCANCAHRRPDHESQLRPLVGLSLDDAQLAWECAVIHAGEGRITARTVKNALQQLDLGSKKPPQDPHPTRAEQQQLVTGTMTELLMLLNQKAAHAVLVEKAEALYRHVQALFAKRKRDNA
jgi:hypothetical protein